MRFKLAIIILYTTAILVFGAGFARSMANSDDQNAAGAQAQKPMLGMDIDPSGRRGLVLYDHQTHEAYERRTNITEPYLNTDAQSMNCVVCHHRGSEAPDNRVDPTRPGQTDVANRKQFLKCSECHRLKMDDERNYTQKGDDQNGYVLNAREAYHRLCISCHMQKKEMATRGEYQIKDRLPLKCAECHNLKGRYEARMDDRQELPNDDPAYPFHKLGPDYSKAPIVGRGAYDKAGDTPTGYAGPELGIANEAQKTGNFEPISDRWRIGFPDDPRYQKGHIYNPYRQNVLKGDYPVFGQHNFFLLTAESETLAMAKRIPVPSNVSAQRPDSEEFFGRGGQFFFNQNFILSFEINHGDSAFKPVDWRIHITPVFNVNYLHTQENGIVNVDFRRGNTRTDAYISLQEAFGDYRLGDTTRIFPFLKGGRPSDKKNAYFDTTTIRGGIQPFISDFRGFIFSDVNLGVRMFGNYANNRYQFNTTFFHMLEKDTNSELNTPHFRNQSVYIANVFRQDTHWKGYTTLFSFHFNDDHPSRHFDENRFLVRPSLIGDVGEHGVKAYYLGFAGDGHMNKWNITHAFYQVFGTDSRNPIAGRETSINAQMAAVELSLDRDWLRFKSSFFFASGDKKPFDDSARGFDSIIDHPEFAGGLFSFWNSQGIPLTNTAVLLTTPGSLLPNLRSSKLEGQANFVNPGIFLYNLGAEAELKPKLRAILNLNYSHFHHPEPLSELLFQPNIRKPIGLDYGGGVLYRPLLSENWIVSAGFSSLIPGTGFRDIYSSNCSGEGCGAKSKILYSAFVKLKFTY